MRTSSLISIVGLVLFYCDTGFGFATFEPYKIVGKTTADGHAHFTPSVRSVADCVRECAKDATCDACDFLATNDTCRLYTWHEVFLQDPNWPGQDMNTVMIRRRLDVVRARSWGGQQVAEDICRVFGGEITTYTELEYAFYNLGLHMGTCGRVAHGSLYYALQYDVDGVGSAGIWNCDGWKPDGDVFCTIPAL